MSTKRALPHIKGMTLKIQHPFTPPLDAHEIFSVPLSTVTKLMTHEVKTKG
jgi:hypothetical protein